MTLAGLHPSLREYADYTLAIGRWYGLNPVVTSVLRTFGEQAALRENYDACTAQGLEGTSSSLRAGYSCRYPANRPGESAHNYGLAWDSQVPALDMDLWVKIRRGLGWHVPPADLIHAEYPDWQKYVVPPS